MRIYLGNNQFMSFSVAHINRVQQTYLIMRYALTVGPAPPLTPFSPVGPSSPSNPGSPVIPDNPGGPEFPFGPCQ